MKFEEAHKILASWLKDEIETPINLYALAVVLEGKAQEPFAYFDPQTANFKLARPTAINVPTTVKVEPVALFTNPKLS